MVPITLACANYLDNIETSCNFMNSTGYTKKNLSASCAMMV